MPEVCLPTESVNPERTGIAGNGNGSGGGEEWSPPPTTAQWGRRALPGSCNKQSTRAPGRQSQSPHPSDYLKLPSREERPTGNSLRQGGNVKGSLAHPPGLRQFLKELFPKRRAVSAFGVHRVFPYNKISCFKHDYLKKFPFNSLPVQSCDRQTTGLVSSESMRPEADILPVYLE